MAPDSIVMIEQWGIAASRIAPNPAHGKHVGVRCRGMHLVSRGRAQGAGAAAGLSEISHFSSVFGPREIVEFA